MYTAVKGAASTAIRLASSAAAAAQAWSAPLAARSLATAASAGGVGKRRGRRVFVVGVGMTKFEKPGRREQFDYPDMAREAGTKALEDAGVDFSAVEQAAVGYVYGDSTCGNRAVYELGMRGVPIYNVNNNCATGSTALFMAQQLIAGGIADCTLALGFEKMFRGSLPIASEDREQPIEKHMKTMAKHMGGFEKAPPAPWLFACAGREHMKRFGTSAESFARVAVKNHKHSVNNPYAQFQDEYTLEEVLSSKMIADPVTMLQCSPTSDGGAAAILASEEFVRANKLEDKAVEILGQAMATDTADVFDDPMAVVGTGMTRAAAKQVFEATGFSPSDVDVCELHDCFSTNELLTYEGLGLCAEGEGGHFIDEGRATYGGECVVNPSGGLESKGHPLGATGLAQCAEMTWQMRGEAGKRQVKDAKLGLQHNLGLGGAVVVGLYQKAQL